MTTIAYKDGVLAADSMVSESRTWCGVTKKLWQSPKGAIAAAAGSAHDCAEFGRWVEGGMKEDDAPVLNENFEGIVVSLDGTVTFYDDECKPLAMDAPHYASGSGGQFALGAMSAGATAEQAVKIAAFYDRGTTGLPVQVLRLPEPVDPSATHAKPRSAQVIEFPRTKIV